MSLIEDPFKEVYHAMNRGTLEEKAKSCPPMPHLVDIELTADCNLQCAMCPTGTSRRDYIVPEKRHIDITSLFVILRECSENNIPVRFIGWGEPTRYTYFSSLSAAIISEKLTAHFNTNGQWHEPLNLAGFSSVKFSVQGETAEQYARIREGARFDILCTNIRWVRRTFPDMYVYVGITVAKGTWPSHYLVNTFNDLGVHEVRVGTTRNILSGDGNIYRRIPECSEVFGHLTVMSDGMITPCCADYNKSMGLAVVDPASTTNLRTAWNSSKLADIRNAILSGRSNEYLVCRRCGL